MIVITNILRNLIHKNNLIPKKTKTYVHNNESK